MPRGAYDRKAKNGKKQWSEAEERYLEEAWGHSSLKTIAKNLGRSENAVVTRIQKLGLGQGLMAGDRISWNQFTKALVGSESASYLKKRLTAAGFPVHSQIIRGRNKARFTTVSIDEFWKFAEQNKDLFDFSKLEPYAFGAEPEWATLKRKLDADRLRKGHSHNDPWTKGEDARLVKLLKDYKYTYSELAEILHRSEGAIKRRICTQGIKERPLRNVSRSWTKDEEQKLINMKKSGYGWDNIADELSRSALCVRGKYERLLNPEYTKRRYRNARKNREKHERQKTCCHFIKLRGCELNRETCKYCRNYQELQEGEKQRSDFIGIREIKPEEVNEHIEAVRLRSGAEFKEVQTV